MATTETRGSGFSVYGPYIPLPIGKYTAQLTIAATGISPTPCGYVDVCCDLGQSIIAYKEFSPLSVKAKSGVIELEFEVTSPGDYEFRVADYGRADIIVASRSLKMNRDYLGLTGAEDTPIVVDEFFMNLPARFQHMVNYGARLSNQGGKLIMTMNGIKMHLRNEEDFQVVDEIHVLNTYNFRAPQRCCVIDIGMNVGLSTLYFAGRKEVEQVHSFEPFAAPYRRAQENIALNPELGKKVHTYNLGLSGETATKTVSYNEATTIGTSVHGNGGEQCTTISLRNASEVLASIIESARNAGQAIIMKMDCEGSEFEIFDDLATSNLLSDVDVLMVEWHKWWSPDKTDETLIAHMLKSGFVVFNTTHLHDQFAGMIYASKAPSIPSQRL